MRWVFCERKQNDTLMIYFRRRIFGFYLSVMWKMAGQFVTNGLQLLLSALFFGAPLLYHLNS